MDSDSVVSQPTQLLQHALAPQTRERSGEWGLASPSDNGNAAIDFSLDSRVLPVQPATPRYHLHASILQSPRGGGEHVLVEDSQKENHQEDSEQAEILVTSPASSDKDVPLQGSGSESFQQHGDSLSASAGKVIGTRSLFFHSPPTIAGVRPHSQPTKPMHTGNRHYRRSPSFPSQDSFGGPISQDPAEQYLASTKQFNVPLSDLGEAPTQEVIHSPTDPSLNLPDASEHKEFFEAAMRQYEAQRAHSATSSRRTNILVPATPSSSGEFSGMSQQKDEDFLFHGSGIAGQQSRFEFQGSSSFDKMLDRDLADGSDSAPAQLEGVGPTQTGGVLDGQPIRDDTLTSPPRNSRQSSPPFEWIAPIPGSVVASSNPRSLIRMVHPNNQYRIAKMRDLAGDVEPPSCVATGAGTQPSGMEETQPCHFSKSTYSNISPPAQPVPRRVEMAGSRPTGQRPLGEDGGDELEDTLDVVPDSEPLRAGPSTQTPSYHRAAKQISPEKRFYPVSPMPVHESGDLVPDSFEVEGSEADVPLAVELAIKTTKKSVAGRTTRAMSSLVPEKKQPQAPNPLSAKGKDSGTKPSKIELIEVPTSLPEQDLQDQALSSEHFPVTTENVLPSKERTRLQSSESSCTRHVSTMCPSAVKPVVAGKKRFHKSDTESSEGSPRPPIESEVAKHRKVQKEEEEESESVGDHVAGSPPPPVSKPEISRNKRRRTEDVNSTRSMSKASNSTRTKRSETPAFATRSVKRLRSGVSSTRVLAGEPATRVFALWKQDGHYYSGVIYSRGPKNKHLVRFDDGTEDEVELKNMRRRELQVGDRVIIIQENIKGIVSNASHADSRGSVQLEIDNGEEVETIQVAFGDIRIANRTIQSQWKERTIIADNMVAVVKPKPQIDTTPSKQSVIGATSCRVQRELVKTGFVVTINPKNEEPTQMKDEAMRAIRQHGGLVIEDWSSVFTMEGKHSQSNKRWTAIPRDFRWKSEVNLDRVFLLSDDAHQKPKFLLALALGIPCLSFEWLTRGGKFSSDWQPFLLPAGYSDILGARISQLIDLDWGNCTEHLTDIMAGRVPAKLFSMRKVLCVGADLVPLPPNRARKNVPEEASRYVPWIILCMGAARVEAVTDIKQVPHAQVQNFDYIIVKERSLLGSVKLGEAIVVGDVNWVKECLVSSRLSIPQLD